MTKENDMNYRTGDKEELSDMPCSNKIKVVILCEIPTTAEFGDPMTSLAECLRRDPSYALGYVKDVICSPSVS